MKEKLKTTNPTVGEHLPIQSGSIYEGEFKEGKFHGQGTFTSVEGKKGVGEFKENKPWNVTEFDKDDNIISRYTDGVEIIEKKLVGVLFTRKEKGEMDLV